MDFDSSIYEAVKTIIDEWYPHGLLCPAAVHRSMNSGLRRQ